MVADGTYTAVLDRFEVGADDERLAVLLLEADGGGDLVVPAADLPANARHQDAVLDVEVVDDDLAGASYRPEETERRAESAQSRFDRLSRRPDEEGG